MSDDVLPVETGANGALSAAPDGVSSRQFGFNVLSNAALLALNTVVNLWFTPYLIGVLGVAMFGIASLGNSLAAYVIVINSSVTGAVGRYLTIHIRRREIAAANRTFNTALYLSLGMALATLPAILAMSLLSPRWFDIPAGHQTAAIWLFAISMLTAVIVMVRGVFATSAFVRNRLDLQNAVLATNTLVRTAATVALFAAVTTPSLWGLSWGLVAGTLVSFAVALVIWRRLTPELRIDRSAFDRTQLRNLSGMSGWYFINYVGSTLLLNIDLIIVNALLGSAIQGRYASVWQWSLLLHTLARTVASALTPVTLTQFAAGNIAQMNAVSRQAVKLLGLMLALPVGLLIAFAAPLLRVWLGPEFTDLAPLMILLTFHLPINLAVIPLFSIQLAMNKITWPALVTLASGVLNVALAFWWGRWDAVGMGVALAAAVVLTLRSVIYIPLYSARIQGLPWWAFFPPLLLTGLGMVLAALIGYALQQFWAVESWIGLALAATAVTLIYAPIIYAALLTRAERQTLSRFLPRRLRSLAVFGGEN